MVGEANRDRLPGQHQVGEVRQPVWEVSHLDDEPSIRVVAQQVTQAHSQVEAVSGGSEHGAAITARNGIEHQDLEGFNRRYTEVSGGV